MEIKMNGIYKTILSISVQICGFLEGTPIQWIEDQKVPYATKNSEWVGFDTKESFETKVLFRF